MEKQVKYKDGKERSPNKFLVTALDPVCSLCYSHYISDQSLQHNVHMLQHHFQRTVSNSVCFNPANFETVAVFLFAVRSKL